MASRNRASSTKRPCRPRRGASAAATTGGYRALARQASARLRSRLPLFAAHRPGGARGSPARGTPAAGREATPHACAAGQYTCARDSRPRSLRVGALAPATPCLSLPPHALKLHSFFDFATKRRSFEELLAVSHRGRGNDACLRTILTCEFAEEAAKVAHLFPRVCHKVEKTVQFGGMRVRRRGPVYRWALAR